VVQRNTLKGENHDLSKVDWTVSGPWNHHRRLFGLNEFAGPITTLAYQNLQSGSNKTPTVDVRKKIPPSLVFELQCIVDATCVSRGFCVSPLRGHVVAAPPQDGPFCATRAADLFLDRKYERHGHGILQGSSLLEQLLAKRPAATQRALEPLLEDLRWGWTVMFAQHTYARGLDTIPASRFARTDPNGLHSYSPYLCGAGLAESLDLAFRAGVMVWDGLPEPLLLMHLHRMLVAKGYLADPGVGLYASLEDMFCKAFFGAPRVEDVPELARGDFSGALVKQLEKMVSDAAVREQWRVAEAKNDVRVLLEFRARSLFSSEKSFLAVLRETEFDVEKIPEEDLPVPGIYAAVRAGMQHQKGMKDSPLLKKWGRVCPNMPPEAFTTLSSGLAEPDEKDTEEKLARIIPGYKADHRPLPRGRHGTPGGGASESLSETHLLLVLQDELESDVCGGGHLPYSALNYLWTTANFLITWATIERKLTEKRNDLYVRAYEGGEAVHGTRWGEKSVRLAVLALREQEDACLKTMAEAFEECRSGFTGHIYWEELGTGERPRTRAPSGDGRTDAEFGQVGNSCCVM
jgi:hypothetical protein